MGVAKRSISPPAGQEDESESEDFWNSPGYAEMQELTTDALCGQLDIRHFAAPKTIESKYVRQITSRQHYSSGEADALHSAEPFLTVLPGQLDIRSFFASSACFGEDVTFCAQEETEQRKEAWDAEMDAARSLGLCPSLDGDDDDNFEPESAELQELESRELEWFAAVDEAEMQTAMSMGFSLGLEAPDEAADP
jgi:hypothetical protein